MVVFTKIVVVSDGVVDVFDRAMVVSVNEVTSSISRCIQIDVHRRDLCVQFVYTFDCFA